MSLDEKVLSLAFKDKKSAMELVNAVDEEFFHPDFRPLYQGLLHFFNDPNIQDVPSRPMFSEFLQDRENATNLLAKFDSIGEIDLPTNEFNWLLQKIRFRRNNEIQVSVSDRIGRVIAETKPSKERVEAINEILKDSMVAIDSISQKRTYREGALSESAQERIEHYNYVEANPEVAQGILTGLTEFDLKTNGIHPGEFVIIAGDTGTGKSVLMHNIAVNGYLGDNDPFDPVKKWEPSRGNNILYFSLEMPKSSMERRIDACIAYIIANEIRDGKLSEEDKQKYFRALRFQADYEKHFHIVDMPKGVTTRDIELKYLEVCASGWKPDLVVIDYMGIMSPNITSGSDWMDLGIISAELHEFSRIYEIATITGSQVNRSKDGTQRYNTDRIARSGMVPTNANVVIQIAKRGDDENQRSDMEIYITKLRDGESGGSFMLAKDLPRMKVQNISDISLLDPDEDEDII